jgi:hypothetical protein
MNRIWYVCGVCLTILLLVLTLVETTFGDDPTDQAREALANDLLRLAKRAQEYYRRPWSKNGGGGSFAMLSASRSGMALLVSPNNSATTVNGCFAIMTAGSVTSVVLRGVGSFTGEDGGRIQIQASVFPDSVYINFIN